MDLSKLKVVDLRAQLQERGLDTKGVKATLIERLQAALEVEEGGAGESDGSSSDVVEVYPSEEVEEELEPPEPEPVIETRRRTLIRHASPPPTLPEPDSPELPQVIEDSSESESPKPELLDSEPEDEPKVEEPVVMKTQFIEEQSVKSESEPEAEDDEDDSPPFETTLQQSKEVEEEEDSESVDSDQMQPAASVIPPLEVKAEEPLDIPQDSEEGDEQSTEESTAILQVKSEIDEDTDMVEAESSEKQDDEAPAKMEATDSSELADKMEATDSSEVPEKTETTDSSEVPEKDSKAPEESSPAIESSGETKEPKRRDNDHKPYESKKRRRSNSQSRSKSPRRLPTPAPNIDDFTNEEDEPEIDPDTVSLSWYDSDLHLRIESTDQFCTARPITTNVLALAWAGARTTHGVRTGKVAYEVQLTEELRSMFVDQKSLHEFRCGWSKQSVDLQLGESALSYGYGSNGKKSNNNTFSDYGCKYGVGDVIGVYLDLESEPCRIEYTVNGKSQGDAFEFDKSELGENEALFPHVMTKSIAFRVNFGQLERCLVNEYKKVKKTKPEAAPVAAVPVAVIKTEEVKEVKEDAVEAPADVAVKKDLDEDVEMPEVPEVKKEDASDDAEKVVAESEESEETKVEIKSEVVEKEEEKIEEELIKEEVKEKVDEIKMEVSEPIEESKENATKDEVESEEEEIDDGVEKVLLPGYMFIKDVPAEELVKGYVRPDSRKECEVILMVGLPGAGKTHWAKQYAADNKQKYFNILGTHVLFEKMKIDGESRKAHHVGRFEKLNEYSIKSLSALQDIANKRRRNYILDQTNVYASAQRRKMKGFGDFKRIAVVVIPDDDEFKRRMELKVKAENKDAPDPALNEMKANFSLPSIEFGWFDELQYTDLETEVAKAKVEEYNEKGRKALPVQISGYKRFRRDDGYGRDRDRRGRRDDRDRDRDRRPSRWGPNADTNRRGGGGGAGGGGRDRWSGAPPPPMPLMQNWRGGGGGGGGYDQRRDRWGGGGGGSMHGHRGGGGGGGRFEPRGGFRGGPQGPPPMHHYNNGPPRPYGGGGGGGDRRDRRGGGGGGDDRRGPRNDRDFRGGGSDRDRDSRDRRDKGKMDVKKGPGGSSHKGYSSNGSGHSSQSQYGQGGWSSGGGGGGAGGWSGGGGSGWSQQPPQQQQQNWGNWQGSGGASNWKGYASSSSGGQYGGGGGGGATGASAAPASTTAAQQQQWASYWSQQQGGGQAGAQHQQSGGSNQWSNWQQYQPAYSTGYAQQPPSAASKSGVAEKK